MLVYSGVDGIYVHGYMTLVMLNVNLLRAFACYYMAFPVILILTISEFPGT